MIHFKKDIKKGKEAKYLKNAQTLRFEELAINEALLNKETQRIKKKNKKVGETYVDRSICFANNTSSLKLEMWWKLAHRNIWQIPY